jgi:nitrate reductase alpha subunit
MPTPSEPDVSWLERLVYLRHGPRINENWTELSRRSRAWEEIYRSRWQHDRVVRSTHGVNCTGSCSWQVYVKDGIITWELQQTDYPSLGRDFPEYEPRGCPRGASFSWYTYSPLRIKYPYVRGELLAMWRAERAAGRDPVAAWAQIVSDPSRRAAYVEARGKGGLMRASWDEATELIAAATVYTIKTYGPDRLVGFSPIPAMSQVSYASGSRFLSLLGGVMLSFYDWYADWPPASPQIWGEQTDVPESADWYNAKYFIIWGTNLPMTRTPDAHFMVEARYNGTKVIGVSPDYAEYEKFADLWLPARAGTDAALAMAMTHVILKECYVARQIPYFIDYVKRFTDLPFLVTLKPHDKVWIPDRLLNAADVGLTVPLAEWKPLIWDERRNGVAPPNGTIGHRWDGSGRWNLKLEDSDGQSLAPVLSLQEGADESVLVAFPYFGAGQGETVQRGVPVKRIQRVDGETLLVTTVFDLLLAHCGVQRPGLPGDYPVDYDDPRPYTPAWQETITGVKRHLAIQVAREFADTAARTQGKCMIALGAGTNHWYHSDQIYRSIISMLLLTGCQGVNGGGWAHYVGQEKVRPLEGWQMLAFGLDWTRPARQMQGTTFFYLVTDQFRYENLPTETLASPLSRRFHTLHPVDMIALASRLGWIPSYPQFDRNPLDLVREARERGARTNEGIVQDVVRRIRAGEVRFATEEPDNPRNFPRVFFIWRSNLLGASGKGHEYFLTHLLGADGHVLGDENRGWRPETVEVPDRAPRGKLDLAIDIDFRMTSTGLYADIILPAATWYEKYDLSTTDMHPFIHPFNPAISPPWEARSDWAIFRTLAAAVARLAQDHLPAQDDLVMVPLSHDTPDELAQPLGKVRDWRANEIEPIPGKTMPGLRVIHRDYPHLDQLYTTLGPLAKESISSKGVQIDGSRAYQELGERVGLSREAGPGEGRPSLQRDEHAVEAILTLSGATNGRRAVEEWAAMERPTGLALTEIARGHEAEAHTLQSITAQPRLALPTPVWSGLEAPERRYAPFTANVEYGIPWRTLTGRQHFYLDHELMLDFGESLPLYRPPLALSPFAAGESGALAQEGRAITVRYLTPHQKWGIHTTYTDTPQMLTLFRGGQTIWLSEEDAEAIGIHDNDWVEVYNRNGAIAARAVVSYRLPAGVAMMYHAQDRTVGVPATSITGGRGGTHNSVTRVIPKPTHMVGGYAHLSYGFNYYGPSGHQRDTLTWIRPLQEVEWLER